MQTYLKLFLLLVSVSCASIRAQQHGGEKGNSGHCSREGFRNGECYNENMMTSGTAENCASRGHPSCRDNMSNVFHESVMGIGFGECINTNQTSSDRCIFGGCTPQSTSSNSSSGNINTHEHNHESAGPSMKAIVSLYALYDEDKYSLQDIARIHASIPTTATVYVPVTPTPTPVVPQVKGIYAAARRNGL